MTKHTLFLRQRDDGTYQATVPAMPGISEVGATREATIEALERSIRVALETTEFVTLDLPDAQDQVATPNPRLSTAGGFADDPTIEALPRDIYAARDTGAWHASAHPIGQHG